MPFWHANARIQLTRCRKAVPANEGKKKGNRASLPDQHCFGMQSLCFRWLFLLYKGVQCKFNKERKYKEETERDASLATFTQKPERRLALNYTMLQHAYTRSHNIKGTCERASRYSLECWKNRCPSNGTWYNHTQAWSGIAFCNKGPHKTCG